MKLRINDADYEVPEVWRDTSLLSFLRDKLGLTGTKFGCGQGLCGACTVHVDGQAVRSCLMSTAASEGFHIKTIEGLGNLENLHPVQQAWVDESVPQCGYCQAGQMMTAAALLDHNPDPSESDITEGMSGNLCRCGTYVRIRKGVKRAAELARQAK